MTVTINNNALLVKVIDGKRAVTFKDVDTLHERPDGTARKRFNDNKERFVNGEDYYRISPSEIRTQNIMCLDKRQSQDIVFLTESGYLMLVKSFTDDLAWTVQRELVNSYFKLNEVRANQLNNTIQTLPNKDTLAIINEATSKVTALNEIYNLATNKATAFSRNCFVHTAGHVAINLVAVACDLGFHKEF